MINSGWDINKKLYRRRNRSLLSVAVEYGNISVVKFSY